MQTGGEKAIAFSLFSIQQLWRQDVLQALSQLETRPRHVVEASFGILAACLFTQERNGSTPT
uniref:Uncharacterized protein n=1 Tax=Octopus bimaculoides TaxID=37653 RepID=A0A0L8GX96_OCTBM